MRVLVALGVLIAMPRPADACSADWDGVSARLVNPPDGATGVPLNARVLVDYTPGYSDPDSTLELRVQGGGTVPITITEVGTDGFGRLLIPSTTLASSTTYELLDTLVLPCDSEQASDCLGAPSVIATFTTSTELDTIAPTLDGLSVSSGVDCFGGTCDFEALVPYEQIQVGSQTDDLASDWIRYEYVSSTGEVLAGPTSALTISRRCSGTPAYRIGINMPADARLRAVDLAGNAEPTSHPIGARTCVDVADACDAVTDAGIDPDGAGSARDGGGGCATGGSSRGWLALLMLPLLRRRR